MSENKDLEEGLGVAVSSHGRSGGPSDPSPKTVSAVPAPPANAFTPGPWVAASKPSSVVGWPVVGELGTLVADVSTMTFPGQPIPKEAAANARLIAAAPDLFEALTDCVKRLRRCAEAAGNAPFAVDALCEQYEAALAKARGS